MPVAPVGSGLTSLNVSDDTTLTPGLAFMKNSRMVVSLLDARGVQLIYEYASAAMTMSVVTWTPLVALAVCAACASTDAAKAADKELKELAKLSDLLVEVELLNAGYHKHKGEWRKRRVREDY